MRCGGRQWTTLIPFTPPRGSIFQAETSEGIALQGPALQCPFATGDAEPDPNALDDGIPLQIHQVKVPAVELRVLKSGTTLCFDF